MLSGLRAVIKDYMLNSSMHGLRFIANDKLHWTERIFWLICVILSWVASILLILSSIDAFFFSAISFGMETSYIDWDTHFPAVAVCETLNVAKLDIAHSKHWPGKWDLEEAILGLVYYKGDIHYMQQYCNKPHADPQCPKNNFSFYANLIRSDCEETVKDCTFNGEEFDCCEVFKPIETDMGRCYIANSDQVVDDDDEDEFEMISNRKKGTGTLNFKVTVDTANVFIIGDEEVPSLTTKQSKFFLVDKKERSKYRRTVSIKVIENDPLLHEITPQYRNCRYPEENYLDVYPKYSRSACIVQCEKYWQKKLCNCSVYTIPNTPLQDQCDFAGMLCLHKNNLDLTVLKTPWAKKPGMVCDCPQSCTEDDLTLIRSQKVKSASGITEVEVAMEYLPSERFKRNVVRGRMELVVSTGGTTGLFLGASLLSFVELLYYLSIRLYGTYYLKKRLKELAKDPTRKTSNSNMPTIQVFNNHRILPIINIKRTRQDFHPDII